MNGENVFEKPVELTLLPSMRFGRLYSTQPDGRKIFLTTDRKLVCPHGELSSTISYWTAMEKHAVEKGIPPFPRGGYQCPSICDCQTTEGLNGKVSADVCVPADPSPSLFEFLATKDVESIQVKGRKALRIPHLESPTFVTTIGTVTCRHGATRRSLIAKTKAKGESKKLPCCGCKLQPLGGALKGIQLGMYAKPKAPGLATAQERKWFPNLNGDMEHGPL